MLTEMYIEALLVDKDLADQVWQLWANGRTDDENAVLAWWRIAFRPLYPRNRTFA